MEVKNILCTGDLFCVEGRCAKRAATTTPVTSFGGSANPFDATENMRVSGTTTSFDEVKEFEVGKQGYFRGSTMFASNLAPYIVSGVYLRFPSPLTYSGYVHTY